MSSTPKVHIGVLAGPKTVRKTKCAMAELDNKKLYQTGEAAVQRLFGAYVIVDYTAAEGKKTGESSMWVGVMKRDVRFRLSYETHNPATRAEGLALLRTLLADLKKRGDRVLLGVNFALGFPRGTAQRLQLKGTPGEAMWDFLAKNVVDKPDNTNNRFQVAAKMNRLMTDDAYPFWGCPKNAAQKWLSTLKPDSFGDFPEFRLTEDATKTLKKTAHAKSLWQMHGAGVVGGQSMLGIAALKALVADDMRVWPLRTGFGMLDIDRPCRACRRWSSRCCRRCMRARRIPEKSRTRPWSG